MRVYVTGASGFVGSRLLPRLRAAGCEPLAAREDLDIRDPDALASDLARHEPDAVVHLAAQSSVATSWRDPADSFRVNFLGTRNLLHAVSKCAAHARVLLIGSADEYETTRPDAAPYPETAGLRPGSPYARTKAAAEMLGTLAAERGLRVLRVRAFNHTGAGQSDRFVASSFARQIAEIAIGAREPRMRVGNLESVRDFLDVDDVVEAYRLLLRPTVPIGIYNVASGRPITIQTLLDTLLDIAGVTPQIEVNPEFFRPTDQLVGDATRLRDATGWSPRISLRETLRSLLEGWRAQLRTA